MPSVIENPLAKSSKSHGLTIITTCETPLYTIATGVSSAKISLSTVSGLLFF